MNLQDTILESSKELWALQCLASIGKKAAFEECEPAELAHLFETIEKRIEAVQTATYNLGYSDLIKAATAMQGGVK
ncbi:hypothetical protein [Thiothrix winogradskyi]|uniref:Uncharacterized protein n=1 Tax=Thiothrix winogradskyi TaxID=96472 RepID=A0ABY3SV87_9GAMM|nr:hypothetical protein [Thiothrix winogradskyi]UJS23368.1 hypothetical protein L2Y54_15655 [Thiothrix winogradskyi]